MDLSEYYGVTVPDLLPDGPLRLLFVGINPGLWTAKTQAHFARRGNRFYPALYRAGLTSYPIDASSGYSAADRRELTERGIGISNLVPHATARADELTREEVRGGEERLTRLVTERSPKVVAVLGITSFRTAFARPKATEGWQDSPWPGTALFVTGNPSGLNAHATVDTLAAAFGEVAIAAGVLPDSAERKSTRRD
ncbi:mismatch-specific DNA-glycosylase [Epidermidibacterium keratini]|uniref:Mismatch-specific DNA-glycosylase n=1 Tax=Epidermidibacterium keratini TaxID=1891644 RepID=A0A7L4YNT9_9ACTN|nr:mismatch-specific DNA-glycosylase [Epidermidibacterium keratini]QHC00806.1 mismatch-specific DNA-glycosylase [Epidermidibacterium keratini]